MVKPKPAGPASKDASAESRMYIDIYGAVMEHRLPPKTKLTEQTLCQIYGLARHNVRKVLALLAADGLVDLEHNRGAFIASPTPEEALEMFELRQSLERLAIQKLMDQTSGSGIKSLKQMVQRERAAWTSGDRATWIRLSADFHVALARLAGNSLLADSLRRLVSRTTLLVAANESPGQNACSFDEHQQILACIESGDKAGAQKSMARHLRSCAQRLIVSEEKCFDLKTALNYN
jgi:DNA-binding GntR family transcriptional regulator